MPLRRCITFTLVSALFACLSSGCASYGPGDLAVDAACGARQEACEKQCEDALVITGNTDRYLQCRDACAPSDETICR